MTPIYNREAVLLILERSTGLKWCAELLRFLHGTGT